MSKKKPEDAIRELDAIEVEELDDKELDAVAGGGEQVGCLNGNCNGCDPGTRDPNGCTNSNCNADLN